MSFKNAKLLDVVGLFKYITGSPTWTAPVLDGQVTVYATGVPRDLLLEAVATSAGMTAVIEPDRIFVGPAAMAKAPWKSGAVEAASATTSTEDPNPRKVVGPAGLSPEDLTPIGFAQTAEGVKAVVYGPWDYVWVLEAGAELYEARVEAVDATGMTFTAKDGRKTVVRYGP